jgi:ferredoxin
MRLTQKSKKKKAYILKDNCMGCGSCVVGCKEKALTFELVRPPEHIPMKSPPFKMPAGMVFVREESLK